MVDQPKHPNPMAPPTAHPTPAEVAHDAANARAAAEAKEAARVASATPTPTPPRAAPHVMCRNDAHKAHLNPISGQCLICGGNTVLPSPTT